MTESPEKSTSKKLEVDNNKIIRFDIDSGGGGKNLNIKND